MPSLSASRLVLHTPALEEHERVEELERNLTHAHGELAELQTERDQLRGRLQAALDEIASLKGIANGPVVVPSIPAASSIAAVRAEMASVPVPASEPTLSRVIVSTRPPADVSRAATAQGSGLPDASDRPSSADRPSHADGPSSAERRRRARLGCEFEVEFLDDTHLIAGLSQDISEGGVFVATYQKLELGTHVTLALELPAGRVQVRGEVRWARQELEDSDQRPGLGVAFTELSPEAVATLTEFCRSHPAHYYEM
jgi:uncharacterized protein (TIGR02266 family)